MPELPEVETIRRGLEKFLVGHRIAGVEVFYRKSLEEGEGKLVGGKVESIRRFAKALVIDLDNGYSAVIHLKMSGQLIYQGPNLKRTAKLSKKVIGGVGSKHTHVIFHLDKGGNLYFNDLRKFGWIKVVKKEAVKEIKFVANLGPEPFELSINKFKEMLVSGRVIKLLLMDQSKISGIGNIYANEALWLAKIDPKTAANKLDNKRINNLYTAIIEVLKKGIRYAGTSDTFYVTPEGAEGRYQEHFLVYDREGKICSGCKKAKIIKSRLGGRGTYYCPICQK